MTTSSASTASTASDAPRRTRSPQAHAFRHLSASALAVTAWFVGVVLLLVVGVALAVRFGAPVGTTSPEEVGVRASAVGGWSGPGTGFVLVLALLAPLGLLAPMVMGGLTRRAFARACAGTTCLLVAVLTAGYVVAALVERAIAPGLVTNPRPGLYESTEQLGLFAVQTAGLLGCWATAGLLVGWAFYRFGGWGTLLLPVVLLPVAAGEGVLLLDVPVAVGAALLLTVPVVSYLVAEHLLARTPLRHRPAG